MKREERQDRTADDFCSSHKTLKLYYNSRRQQAPRCHNRGTFVSLVWGRILAMRPFEGPSQYIRTCTHNFARTMTAGREVQYG